MLKSNILTIFKGGDNLARYGSGKNANSGNKRIRSIKNKVAREKNITQVDPTESMNAHEKMMALFKDEGFDISDPNGLVILNSRNNYKQYGSPRS